MGKVRHYWRIFAAKYRKIFSIDEIESGIVLQWMFGAMLFYFFVTFFVWSIRSNITAEAARNAGAVCWPFFQSCADFYVLHALPYGYSHTTVYMALYGIMLLIVYCMWRKQWVHAHMLLLFLLLWKIFELSLNYLNVGPYDYYHIFLTAALLFIPFKEYFLKLLFVLFYFMSVTVKFSPAWIEGTYFSSLVDGIPLFPDWLIPIATNIVIFEQVVGAWFLLSRNWILQRASFAFAVFFHLYSGILVIYNYPSISLPPLLILFGPMYRHTKTPFTRAAIAGWCLVVIVALFQLLGFSISSDRYLTLEGNRYGMFMFEANHQCIATVTRYTSEKLDPDRDYEVSEGTPCGGFYCLVKRATMLGAKENTLEMRYESGTAWNRCDPYEWWSKLRNQCKQNPNIHRIALQFDHSINGGPFYRIVEQADMCDIDYAPFTHNSWILVPPEAKVVGYPVQNWYHY